MERLDNPTQEELFLLWCEDAIKAGYIKKVITDSTPIKVYPGLKASKITKKLVYKGTKREKIKETIKSKIILESVTYKPDAIVIWTEKAKNVLFTVINSATGTLNWRTTYFYAQKNAITKEYISSVEVKAPPGYGGANSSDLSFRILQKWIYDSRGIFINKVRNSPNSVIKDKKTKKFKRFKNPEPYLWMTTFTPERYFYTDKTLKDRTISYWKPRTLKEFEDENISVSLPKS